MNALVIVLSLLTWPALAQTPPTVYPPASSKAVAPAAADQTLGMAMMSAVVRADGTLVRGTGAISSTLSSPGRYLVSFERSISDCTITVTAGDAGAGTTLIYFYTGRHLDVKAVTVGGVNPINFASVNGSFHLLAFCHQ